MTDLDRLAPPKAGSLSSVGSSSPQLSGVLADNALYEVVTQAVAERAPETGWQIDPGDDRSPWIRVRRAGGSQPAQGWKLHITATPGNAVDILRRALDVLLTEETVTFKVATSLRFLAGLNQGDGGMSQIGKFITIYPADDNQALSLATRLDEATHGLRGPAVLSDRPLQPGSLVHYRYGGFEARFLQESIGEIVPAIVTPAGELVADRRHTTYYEPDWVTDPFLASGVATSSNDRPVLLCERFAPLAVLHGSPRGTVYLALDTADPKTCVLKQARPAASFDARGYDAQDRLRYEADILHRLAPDPRFPACYGLFEDRGDLFLAMEDVAGDTLSQWIAGYAQRGQLPNGQLVVDWGRELAGLLAAVHQQGLIYRDLKPANVIWTTDGRFRLIDLELAHDPSSAEMAFGLGTRGYMSPQQRQGEPPAVTDDVYAFGALLYLLATSAEPSMAPDPTNLLARPVTLLNPTIGRELADLIARCLDPDPARRFASMREIETALAAIGEPAAPTPAFGTSPGHELESAAGHRAAALARRLGETICTVSIARADGSRAWASAHSTAGGFLSPDLNTGGAGPLLALAELTDTFPEAGWRETLAAGARWLRNAPRPGGESLPGLYIGESGVGAALLRAGQVLADPDLIDAATERANRIATMPYRSPDLFNGTAGRLRFHLWLWDATGAAEQLGHANAAAEMLLAAAETMAGGAVRWVIPAGYGGLSGVSCFGYAHGAAGIADVLLDLFETTADRRLLATARGAADWLAASAVPFLPDGSGRAWPNRPGEPSFGGFWCHGATGVGRFFLHAAQLDLHPNAWALAEGAARSVAAATRASGPTQCHGLAGNIEFLIDMYQATGDVAYLRESRILARLLEAFSGERDGCLVWPSDSPTVFSPDYTVGYAGVAACLLRLSDPERRPHQLSRQGFQYRHGATSRI